MRSIETLVLNPWDVDNAERMMVCAARLTQGGHKIKSLNDFLELYFKEYTSETVAALANLPHPTLQKFGLINVAVVGASRRFLAQITRHQNEVKFMSASLQYSDYSDGADFVTPYNLLGTTLEGVYRSECKRAMDDYKFMIEHGLDNDSAGYIAPQGLRNVLIISATPYQWKHMIGQRTCQRNTDETRYVMLRIWEQLYLLSPRLFAPNVTGPGCARGGCQEGKMTCRHALPPELTPSEILKHDYPELC